MFNSKIISVFMSGIIFALSVMGMFQDFLGLEAYVEYARRTWIVLPWWLWIIPLAGSLAVYIHGLRTDERNY